MFYNQQAIDFLINRIEWAAPIPPTQITFVPDNVPSLSGRYFKTFHESALVENIYSTVCNAKISQSDFSDYLKSLKSENVLSILTIVFDNEDRAYYRDCIYGNRIDISGIDYSDRIQTNSRLFDNLIGLGMAIKVIELFLSTNRANSDERGLKFDYAQMKEDLEGIISENGKVATKGLYAKFQIELEKVKDILFPIIKTNYVVGRHIW